MVFRCPSCKGEVGCSSTSKVEGATEKVTLNVACLHCHTPLQIIVGAYGISTSLIGFNLTIKEK